MITLGIDGEFEISALPCLEVHRKDGGLGQLAKDGLENLSEFIDAEGAQAMPGAPDPEQAGITEDEHLQRHHVLPGMPVAAVGERCIPISGHELPLGGGPQPFFRAGPGVDEAGFAMALIDDPAFAGTAAEHAAPVDHHEERAQRLPGRYRHPEYSSGRDDHTVGSGRLRMQLGILKSGITEHPLEVGEGVGLALRGGSQHDEAEGCRRGRRDAVFVGHEFHDDHLSTGAKGGVDALQEGGALGGVEMVQEVRHEHDVIICAEVNREGVASDGAESVRDARRSGILRRDGEHGLPIKRHEMHARILPGEGETEGTVARRNVEHPGVPRRVQRHERGGPLGDREHQGPHGLREIDPSWMIRGRGAMLGGVEAAFADGLGKIGEGLRETRRKEEIHGSAKIGRRGFIQKNGGRRREGVMVSPLGEEAEDGEMIAQNADAALRTIAPRGDLARRSLIATHVGEDSQIDRGLQCGGALVGIDRVKEELRRWRGSGVGHDDLSSHRQRCTTRKRP